MSAKQKMTSRPDKLSIRSSQRKVIEDFLESVGEKKFRYGQIMEWLWKKGVGSFDEMTNLSVKLRNDLSYSFFIDRIKIERKAESSDGTIKVLFRLIDDNFVEGVLIPSKDRETACISTQIGCSYACAFCATGTMQLKRNLTIGEIFDQVVLIGGLNEKEKEIPVTNIVVMGMGEPFANFDNLISALTHITDPKWLGMSPQRITISTVGIPEKIKAFADLNTNINLAISLHAGSDTVRNKLMPVNKKHNLDELIEAIIYFNKKTGLRITYEYLILDGINDSPAAAEKLARFCKRAPCKINIIEYNPVAGFPFRKSSEERMNSFVKFLENRNIVVNVRKSRGDDIQAACGQLANDKNNTSNKC